MTGRISIPELRAQAEKANREGCGCQEYSNPELHELADGVLALVGAVEAARATAPFLPQIHRDALNRYLSRFDFGNDT